MADLIFTKGREPVNIVLRVVLAADNVPQRAPGVEVPAGCSVYVRGHNGTDAGNAHPVKVAAGLEECLSSVTNRSIAANTQIPFPVQNTRDICVVGSNGDGVEITVIGG